MITFLVLLPLEKISVFLGILVCMTGGGRVFIAALLAFEKNSVRLDLLVSASDERVEVRGEEEGIIEFIVLLSLEKDSVCLSSFRSIFV
jgi:hypothetical protein